MNLWKIKRRLEQEMRGIKYLMSGNTGRTAIRVTNIIYEATRVAYNPLYLIEIGRRQLIKNLI